MMTEKHLIALDLDGTLLKDDKTISYKTKHVINKAREESARFGVSTVGSKAMVGKINKEIKKIDFSIAFFCVLIFKTFPLHHHYHRPVVFAVSFSH